MSSAGGLWELALAAGGLLNSVRSVTAGRSSRRM